MMRKIQFEDLTETIVCRENDTAMEVARILRDTNARHLIVLADENKPSGIISTTDINNRIVAEGKDIIKTKAKDFMTKDIVRISKSSELADAIVKMSERNISSLPVIDENSQLVGVLEFTNALRALNKYEKQLKEGE